MSSTVLVLGSGPIRIGQGIEFDYSCVHCVWALEKLGYRAIIVNNNPETVSTDFDTGDGLYFEPVSVEDVMDVVRRENPMGVVCQFGGQTAINLAEGLQMRGVPVLGTSPEAIARAEDRGLFDQLLEKLGIARPAGKAVRSVEEALATAEEVGYPVLVRPSFVLGGRAMEIVADADSLADFYQEAEDANPGQPVLVDKYLIGAEAEVDVISDGEDTLVPGLMEHIERAGIHSGDSMAVYPPVGISQALQAEMVRIACGIAKELGVHGLMNIQFVIQDDRVYVLEVNPRASRTVPYISKVTGIPMVDLATHCMMGGKLADFGLSSGLWVLDTNVTKPERLLAKGRIVPVTDLEREPWPAPCLYAVKAPVFSFQKLALVEPSLGPEMKSTGEVLGIDSTYEAALYKALIGSGINFKPTGYVVLTLNDNDKVIGLQVAQQLVRQGFLLAATEGTHRFLAQHGVRSMQVGKIQDEGSETNLLALIRSGEVSLMINTPEPRHLAREEALHIRRASIESGIACVTSIDTALALARALDFFAHPERTQCRPYTDYLPR